MILLVFFAQFQTGDIIFQESRSNQSAAIQLATNSRYSHVGIILEKQEGLFVLEASGKVIQTPIQKWIKRGQNGDFVVLRHLKLQPGPSNIQKSNLMAWIKTNLGKPYDSYFEWTDERLYCSELVWKIYKTCFEIELCQPKSIVNYNLNHPMVKKLIEKRWGERELADLFVAPSDLLNAPNLQMQIHLK